MIYKKSCFDFNGKLNEVYTLLGLCTELWNYLAEQTALNQ